MSVEVVNKSVDPVEEELASVLSVEIVLGASRVDAVDILKSVEGFAYKDGFVWEKGGLVGGEGGVVVR